MNVCLAHDDNTPAPICAVLVPPHFNTCSPPHLTSCVLSSCPPSSGRPGPPGGRGGAWPAARLRGPLPPHLRGAGGRAAAPRPRACHPGQPPPPRHRMAFPVAFFKLPAVVLVSVVFTSWRICCVGSPVFESCRSYSHVFRLINSENSN